MRLLAGLLLLVLVFPSGGHGQLVRGAVRSEGDSLAIASALVRLIDEDGVTSDSTVTDSLGGFILSPKNDGRYMIHVSHVGYLAMARPIDLERGYELTVVLTMATNAIALEPLVVTARRRVPLEYNGFYRRSRMGTGRFLTREDIERRNPIRTTDLFHVIPRVQLISADPRFGGRQMVAMRTYSGGYCAPNVYIDGMLGMTAEDINMLLPEDIDGVEIYTTPALTPIEYQRNSDCGAILFWLRKDARGSPFTWKRLFIGVGAFLGLLLLSQ
ncbi:MAG: TonB-dependent receptor [Candidatus Cloacimonetes bacterium]|jgi:hypothetical protein|nr:TonB-dependent receptor [Candidatus Cloacimonadota bacterium]